ncbi:uncharacterized protein [Arachis hypogaea]|uniref:uncharacterized protein isoform X5 n=1 Tax=Arachis hypogaea TaxID=3818 RepID=UPI000A2C1F5C
MNQKSIDSMVYFLNKFCTLSKSLQMVQQLRLFRVLMNEGIFDVIIQVLQSQDKKLVLIGYPDSLLESRSYSFAILCCSARRNNTSWISEGHSY